MISDLDIIALHLRADARNLDAAKIGPLADSIAALGLINPLRVRAMDDGYEVIAGAHRLQAAKTLGLVEITCDIVEDDDLHAELAMIDENLCRAELTVVDRVRQVARRKALYETLHPETRHGAAGGDQSRQVGDSVDRFTADTARMTGQSERKVQRDAERGTKVCATVLDLIRVTPLNTGRFLDSIKNLSPQEQMRVARAELAEISKLDVERRRMRNDAKKHARELRERELAAKQVALPDKRYGVIYADPEWRFEPYNNDTGMDRAADNHYPTSTLDDIKARAVPAIAADDCALFLWATVPMLPQALDVMAAWGFTYKSHFIWAKDRLGTGYWNRNQHELVLLGTRGNVPCPAMGDQWPSLLSAPVGDHSAKPVFGHELIEDYFPNLPKIELNARKARAGWDCWGNEAPDVEGEQEHGNDRQYGRPAGGEQYDAPSISGADGCREGDNAGHEGPRAGVSGLDRQVRAGAGNEHCQDQDGRSGDVGGEGSDGLGASRTNEITKSEPSESLVRSGAGVPPADESTPPDLNATIRAGYRHNLPLAELARATGLSTNAVKQRAKRMGLGDRARQLASVSKAKSAPSEVQA